MYLEKYIKEHISDVKENQGGDYYIDDEYSIQSQMTDEVLGLLWDEDIDIERHEVNETLDEFEDDLDLIKEMVKQRGV